MGTRPRTMRGVSVPHNRYGLHELAGTTGQVVRSFTCKRQNAHQLPRESRADSLDSFTNRELVTELKASNAVACNYVLEFATDWGTSSLELPVTIFADDTTKFNALS